MPPIHSDNPHLVHCARTNAIINPSALMIDPTPGLDAPLFANAPTVATGAGVKIALLIPLVVAVLMVVTAAADVLDAVVVIVLLSVTSAPDVLDAVIVTVLLSVTSAPDVLDAVVVTVLKVVTSPPDVLDAEPVCVPCEPAEFDELAARLVELAPPPTMTPLPVVMVETEVEVTSVVVVGTELPDGVDEIPIRVSVRTVVEAADAVVLPGNVEVKICVAVSRVVDVPCTTTGPVAAVFDAVAELVFVVSGFSVTIGTETVATVTPARVDM